MDKAAWKRGAALSVWLWLFLPVGLWKLWKDDQLSATVKWRIFFYTFLIPILMYFAYSFWAVNQRLAALPI